MGQGDIGTFAERYSIPAFPYPELIYVEKASPGLFYDIVSDRVTLSYCERGVSQ